MYEVWERATPVLDLANAGGYRKGSLGTRVAECATLEEAARLAREGDSPWGRTIVRSDGDAISLDSWNTALAAIGPREGKLWVRIPASNSNFIPAVKALKNLLGLGLREARDLAEWARLGWREVMPLDTWDALSDEAKSPLLQLEKDGSLDLDRQ